MRPTLVTGLLSLVALGGAVAPGTAAADKLTLSAKTTTCTTGADDASRAAAFTGTMPAGAQAKRMQMRFVLLQRLGPGPGLYKKVAVPGWGGWEKSDPGRVGFVFTKRVEALAAPAAYRAVVTFRWLDAKGHVQRIATRSAPACEQPDPRADLVLGGLDAAATGTTTAAYTVSVGNEGHSVAGTFAVTLTVDGVVSGPLTLGPLAAGDRAQGTLAGPKCEPGSTITVTVDAGDAVDESVEADDIVQRPCPLA